MSRLRVERHCRRGDRGQATVELALLLPVIVLLSLLVVQVAAVARAQVVVTHAAREGARAAAVDDDPGAAARAAAGSSGLEPNRLTVTSHRGPPGATVSVTVTFRVPTDVPFVGALLPDVPVSADATMRVE
jgi:Flp pilus assembly protein TadG